MKYVHGHFYLFPIRKLKKAKNKTQINHNSQNFNPETSIILPKIKT